MVSVTDIHIINRIETFGSSVQNIMMIFSEDRWRNFEHQYLLF